MVFLSSPTYSGDSRSKYILFPYTLYMDEIRKKVKILRMKKAAFLSETAAAKQAAHTSFLPDPDVIYVRAILFRLLGRFQRFLYRIQMIVLRINIQDILSITPIPLRGGVIDYIFFVRTGSGLFRTVLFCDPHDLVQMIPANLIQLRVASVVVRTHGHSKIFH